MTTRQYMTKLLLFVACTMTVLSGCVRREQPELVDLKEETSAPADASAGTSSVSTPKKSESFADTESAGGETGSTVTVYVCGAVKSPGVYVLDEGARICDAVEAAGGFEDNADESYVNQAQYVSDAQKVEIPTKEEAAQLREQNPAREETKTAGGGQEDEKVSINDADVTELMSLPGIGESKAKAIVTYREKNGRFQSLEDLMKVPGIKQASFDKLKDSIRL